MAFFQFTKLQLNSKDEYEGTIERIKVSKDKRFLIIIVSLDDFENEEFSKCIPFSLNMQGELARMFVGLGAMNKKGQVDTKWLEGVPVIVTLRHGSDSRWYVDKIWIAEEDNEEDDEEALVFDDEEEE